MKIFRKSLKLIHILLAEDNELTSILTKLFLKNLVNVDHSFNATSGLHMINGKNY